MATNTVVEVATRNTRVAANPILWNEATEADFDAFNHSILNRALSASLIGDRNPCWNAEDDTMLEIRNRRALGYIQPLSPVNGQINDRIAHRFPVSDLNLPRDHVAVLQTAIRYAYENPFVSKASRIKADFSVEGMKHRTHNLKVKEYYDEWAATLDFRTLFRKIFFSMFSIGIVPIWWGGEETRNIEFIELLDPRMVHIEYNFGRAQLYLKIDEKMRAAVADPTGRADIRNKYRYEAMPKYWVAQIEAAAGNGGKKKRKQKEPQLSAITIDYVELKEGSFALVDIRASSLNRTVSALDGLPTQPAFDALQRYRLFTAGDFAVAWSLKNMVTLISEGDPKAEGESWKPVSAQRLANLQSNFQRPDSSYTVYCDPTVEVRFVVPPLKEVFAENKYSQVEKEIKEVLDLPSFMWISEDKSNYSNAANEMKVFRQAIKSARNILIDQFITPLYKRLRRCASRPGFKESDICLPSFSVVNLQDDASYQNHMLDLYSAGLVSVETMCEINGLDYEYEAKQKEDEKKLFDVDDDTVWRPLFNPAGKSEPPGKPAGSNPAVPSGSDTSPRRSGQK